MKSIVVQGEPQIVSDTRNLILETFKDLIFIEEGHKYYLNGQELPSVSGVTHQFKPEFDSQTIAKNYAKKHGQTPEYWLDQWKFKNLISTTRGTLVHSWAENYAYVKMGHPELITEDCKSKYYKEKNWLIPTRPKEEAILKFYNELSPNFWVVMPETRVFSCVGSLSGKLKQDYCGCFDLLMYYLNPQNLGDPNNGLWIFDWKNNGSLFSEYNRSHNKNCLAPFADLPDDSFSMYELQLSCYQMPLEALGLKIIGRRVIWLKEDGGYELFATRDFTERLKTVL